MRPNRNIQPLIIRTLVAPLALGTALAATGCGPAAFVPGMIPSDQNAPGTFTVPPKVDILLAEDDSGSQFQIKDAIKNEFPELLSKLDQSGWDYRLATIPLTRLRTITEVAVSKYDSNFFGLGLWQESFPGANPFDTRFSVPASVFKTPGNYRGFMYYDSLNVSANAAEPAFSRIESTYFSSSARTNFWRLGDALQVVFVVSNGEDDTGVNKCRRYPDNYLGLCEHSNSTPPGYTPCPSGYGWDNATYTCRAETWQSSLDDAIDDFNNRDMMVYSAVSFSNTSNCLGTNARTGYRYIHAAQQTGGRAYDICNESISSIVTDLKDELTFTVGEFVRGNIVVGKRPNLASVSIRVFPGGDHSAAYTLPQDPINGWSYDTSQGSTGQCAFTIVEPVDRFEQCGFVFQLNGLGRIRGNDQFEILFTEYGAVPSS